MIGYFANLPDFYLLLIYFVLSVGLCLLVYSAWSLVRRHYIDSGLNGEGYSDEELYYDE